MLSSNWQSILAQDARWNSFRQPYIRNMYLRRRSQLLADVVGDAPSRGFDKNYMRLRSQLLTLMYGSPPELRRTSRSDSTATFHTVDLSLTDASDSGRQWTPPHAPEGLTPSKDAHASRALAGIGTESLSMSYTFSGVHHIFEQGASVNHVAFANNCPQLLCTADAQGVLCIYQVDPPKALHRIAGHSGPIVWAEWSHSNDVIITCSLDGSLSVWDAMKGALLRSIRLQSNTHAQQQLSQQQMLGQQIQLQQQCNCDPVLCAAFQPANNNMLAMGSGRGMIQVISVSTGMVVRGGSQQLQSGARALSMAFSICGTLLWVGDDKGSISSYVFDIASGRLSRGRRFCAPGGGPVTCLSFRHWVNRQARDPCLLVNSGGLLLVYGVVNPKDGTLVLKKRLHVCNGQKTSTPLKSCFSPIMSFRDGSCVVTGSDDGGLVFFDVTPSHPASPVNRLQGHSAPIRGVAFAADERMLASADASGVVILWKKGHS
ncbi:WD repeat-containing protein 13-like isoform X1 [Varroa jacobsoni]|uniref:WD repeat-containing protein 13-like isoform X1 n=1 Tax=Varroa jacobsoni TaxID=62625 RepID=UPI000BF445E8|nr:WD repeat-containing protein 13-like isoform X1 [Varroa jacobsoni]XP_022708854.1 WD repeat-containing protein 13-like isoform X1 [Varroa jacobsoni]